MSVTVADAATRTRLMITVRGAIAQFHFNDDAPIAIALAGPVAPDVSGTLTLGGFSPALQLLRYHGSVSHARVYRQVLVRNPAPL